MKKIGIHSAFFVAGIFITLLVTLLYSKRDVDMLSMSINQPVITKRDLILIDEHSKKIILPSGTSLMLKSQYREEGTFLLEIVSSNLEDFQKIKKQQIYFQKTE